VVEQADILHLRMRLLELNIGLYKKIRTTAGISHGSSGLL